MEEKNRAFKQPKPLEELNVIDDFLFNEIMSDEQNGEEVCRMIIETALKRRVEKISFTPQKTIPGISEKAHGIRLDAFIREYRGKKEKEDPDISVYDVEPDKQSSKKESLPKRSRYYGDLIDRQLLEVGTDYDKLPEMVIIFILPYDPFGENAMYYEAGTTLKTHPDIPYNDGVRRIYLFTGGKLPKGAAEADKKLKNLLIYINESTEANITDEATRRLDDIVRITKAKKDLGVKYMKSWEVIEEAHKEGREEGREEGRKEERVNTEREKKRAERAEAALAAYKAKYGEL